MTNQDLLAILEEGLKNGRIAPHLAAYIAGEVLDVDPFETDYSNWAAVADEFELSDEVEAAA